MQVNNTIKLLEEYAATNQGSDSVLLLRDDIIQSVKFDLGDAYVDLPKFKPAKNTKLEVPKLPFDKVYFEVVAYDGKIYGALFENYDGEVCGQMLVEAQGDSNPSVTGLFPIGVMFIQHGDKLSLNFSEKGKFKDFEIGAIGALSIMINAISVINCTNVITIESKEKKFINARRKKKSKLPLFTYKTLHLDISEREEEESHGKGDRSGPRVHLRRGHIRTLANGNKTWVQPCVVGNKKNGIVHKDYSVSVH